MTQEQLAIVLILIATLGMFLWGRWRHDMVAIGALLARRAAATLRDQGLTPEATLDTLKALPSNEAVMAQAMRRHSLA